MLLRDVAEQDRGVRPELLSDRTMRIVGARATSLRSTRRGCRSRSAAQRSATS